MKKQLKKKNHTKIPKQTPNQKLKKWNPSGYLGKCLGQGGKEKDSTTYRIFKVIEES